MEQRAAATPLIPAAGPHLGQCSPGYGMEFLVENAGRVRNSYKDGVNADAGGILRYHPADHLDVVVLSNSEQGDAWGPVEEIHRLVWTANPVVGESGVGFT